MDRHDLYEACVQNPALCASFLRALHGKRPRRLLEDFCAGAALARRWISEDPFATAIARDVDAAMLERAARLSADGDGEAALARLLLVRDDLRQPSRLDRSIPPADVVFVGNFSIGEFHTRGALVQYLRDAHANLAPGGVCVCDTYGGSAAYRTGGVTRTHAGRTPSTRLHCTWEQRDVDPFTRRVRNVLHFRVEHEGEIVGEFPEAFTYDWRLWTVAELREAMVDAGFARTSVHDRLDDPHARPDAAKGREHHIVCVAGWV
jgi:hypothetical protein